MLSLDALMTAPVILAASASWALGVGGSAAWNKSADWRMLNRHRRRARAMLARGPDLGRDLGRDLGHEPWHESRWSLGLPNSRPSTVLAGPAGVRPSQGGESRRAESVPPPLPVGYALKYQPPAVAAPHFVAAKAESVAGIANRLPDCPPGSPPDSPHVYPLRNTLPGLPQRRPVPHLLMSPANHLIEFLAWQRDCALGRNPKTGRWECRRSSADMLLVYQRWAEARSLAVIPDSEFLRRLSDAPGVEKSRDRLKDSKGRVLRNDRGTPLRTCFYSIVERSADSARTAPKRAASSRIAAKPQMDAATRDQLLAALEREPERVRRAA